MALKEYKPEKLLYSMGEVTEMFDVKPSLIRFWEQRFDILKPKKNKKGNRLFTPADVKNLEIIYHLTKERGMTLSGVEKYLKNNKAEAERETEIVRRLQTIRSLLVEIREELKENTQGEVSVFVANDFTDMEPVSELLKQESTKNVISQDSDHTPTTVQQVRISEDEPEESEGEEIPVQPSEEEYAAENIINQEDSICENGTEDIPGKDQQEENAVVNQPEQELDHTADTEIQTGTITDNNPEVASMPETVEQQGSAIEESAFEGFVDEEDSFGLQEETDELYQKFPLEAEDEGIEVEIYITGTAVPESNEEAIGELIINPEEEDFPDFLTDEPQAEYHAERSEEEEEEEVVEEVEEEPQYEEEVPYEEEVLDEEVTIPFTAQALFPLEETPETAPEELREEPDTEEWKSTAVDTQQTLF